MAALTDAQLLAPLLHHAPPALAVDGSGACVYANPAAAALAIDPQRPLVGDCVVDRLPMLADPGAVDLVAQAVAGRGGEVEVTVPGTGRVFTVRAAPGDGAVLLYLEDATGRRSVEALAARNEQQARLASLAGSAGIFRSDLTTAVVSLSEQARRIAGFEPTADGAYPRAAIEAQIHPDDRARYRQAIAVASANPGAVYDITYRLTRQLDGEAVLIHVVGEVLADASGRPAEMVGAIADFSERSAAEEALRISEDRLRQTIEGVDAIISFREDEHAAVVQSPQVEPILGYRPEDLTDNAVWDDLVHPDDRAACMAAWQAPGAPGWNLVYRIRRADGQYIWVEDRGRWIERGGGRGRGFIGVTTDITERKRVEDALRDNEERLRRTVEGVDGIITYRESSTAPTIHSPQVERILGYPPEALPTEEAWFELVHPEDRQRVILPSARLAPSWLLTYRMRRADGTWIWVDDRGQRFPIDGGRDWGYVGVVVDATDRVDAGRARRLADERRRRFFDANIVGTLVTEADGRVLEANDYWLHLVGRTREELDRGELDWRAMTAPESLDADDDAIAQCRESGSSRPYEKTYVRPDGTRVPTLVVRASMPGADEQFATFALDLTERNAAAAEMAQLVAAVDQTSESVVITDTQATIRYVNPAFERTSGFSRAEAVGQNPRLLQSGVHGREFYAEMWATLGRGETWHGELVNRRKDGTLYTEVAAISPMRDADGRLTAYVGVKRDVTAERELEARLAQTQRLDSLGQLAGGIAHDFNNLLAVIRGYADLARAALPPSGPGADDLDQIVLAADRASSLTRQLLLFGRRQSTEPRVVAPALVVDELALMLRRLLGEHIDLAVDTGGASGSVRADPGQLEQVVVNMAANARDAMPDGGRLTIAVANVDDDTGAWVRMTVADTGIGMDRATAARVFEPFFTTKEPGRGTGLGLSTVYGIVSQSGGRVSVASTPGEGTTFTIDLVRIDAARAGGDGQTADGDGPAAGAASAAARGAAQARPALAILLVEDDASVRSLTSRMLTALGHAVTAAASGPEALELVASGRARPDLLVTDVRMPGMQGPELARRLRERMPGLPVVFTSGFSAELGDSVAIEGARVLDKPFEMRDLDAVVRAAAGPASAPD